MGGKISGVASTSKPNGGYRCASPGADPKAAGADMGRGDFTGASALLNEGLHPDAIRTPNGATALLCCVAQREATFARRLLLAGANPNRAEGAVQEKTYLGHAVAGADAGPRQAIVELLLEFGADPNMACDPQGRTPLILAAMDGNPGPAKALAAKGADPFLRHGASPSAAELALRLPDFQMALMLAAMLPAPATAEDLDRLAALLDPARPELADWIARAWGGGPKT